MSNSTCVLDGPPATERQISYIRDLVAQRDPANETVKLAQRRLDTDSFTKARAGVAIDMLLAIRAEGIDLTELPAGYYAVPQGETRLKVCIEKPEEGDWAGWIFVKDGAVYGEGQTYGQQRPKGFYIGKIADQLRAILADPGEAMAEYGRLTETCGYCGRHLENEASVERGIGPKCARKMGMA